MEHEVVAAVKHIIIMLVIVGIVLMIAITSMGVLPQLQEEVETVGAAGFVINMTPVCKVITPQDYWEFDFGNVTLRDPQRRTLDVVPVLEIVKFGSMIQFAEKRAGITVENVSGYEIGRFSILDGRGEASLAFRDFPEPGNVSLRIGLWVWSDCFSAAIGLGGESGYRASRLFHLLNYTSLRCPDAFIGVLDRVVDCK